MVALIPGSRTGCFGTRRTDPQSGSSGCRPADRSGECADGPGGSALFPQVNGTGQFRRSWDLDGSPGDTSSLGLTLDWEIDVWGRIRYRQAARAQKTEAAFDDWLAARLLLTASVAEARFGAIEQRGQLALSADQIEVYKKLLGLTQLRFGQGLGSSVDVLHQKQQLQSVEALVPDIKFRIEAFELVLDTLTGRVSGDRRRATTAELPDPPAVPRAGYPSSLLQERPDLRARRARIVALDNEVGEAIADRLPRFAIGGSVAGAGTVGLDKLIAGVTTGNRVLGAFSKEGLPEILERYPGLRYSFEGDQREERDAMRELLWGLIASLTAIYVIMAAILRS